MLSSDKDDDPVQKLCHVNAYSLMNVDSFPPCPSSPRAFELYSKFRTLLQMQLFANYDRHENENDAHSDRQNEIDAQNNRNDAAQNSDGDAKSPETTATGTDTVPGTTGDCTSSTPSYRNASKRKI